MFPRAIQQASKPKQVAYSLFLPIALFIWILPLLAVFLTSVRGAKDINTGNVQVGVVQVVKAKDT